MYKNLSSEELIGTINNLKLGEKIFITIEKEVGSKIEYFQIQKDSYESLFKTCLSFNEDITNEFILNDFIEAYIEVRINYDDFLRSVLLSCVGREAYDKILTDRIMWNFNTKINLLEIYYPLGYKKQSVVNLCSEEGANCLL